VRITVAPYTNLGAVSSIERHQKVASFEIENQEVDFKQAEIELSRKRHTEFVQSSSAILQGATPTQLVNTQENSMTISNGIYYRYN